MCARYTLYHPVGLLASHFAALSDDLAYGGIDLSSFGAADREEGFAPADPAPSYNIAPTHQVVAVMENGRRTMRWMRWGLMARRSGPQHASKPLVNARAETLLEKPAFRDAAQVRRCIIPASGFYEWKKVRKVRMPFYISRCDGQPMAFAGLWDTWNSPDGSVRTCSIVTVEANAVIAPLHDRMPAILGPDEEGQWLDVSHVDGREAAQLLRPCPDDWLRIYAVSPRMNRPSVNDPECIVSAEHDPGESLTLFGDEI